MVFSTLLWSVGWKAYCHKETGSFRFLYHNYKGIVSIVMLALVDGDYKFIWTDVAGNGACSDAQMYNEFELREATEDGSIGFPNAEPLPNDTEDVPYYFHWR